MVKSKEVDIANLPNVFISDGVKDVELTYQNATFTLKVKEIPWTKTNQIVAKCTTYGATGQVGMNLDQFYREYLTAAVVDSPWGTFTPQIVDRFTQAFGDLLVATLIPNIGPGLPGGEAEEHFFEPASEQVS